MQNNVKFMIRMLMNSEQSVHNGLAPTTADSQLCTKALMKTTLTVENVTNIEAMK